MVDRRRVNSDVGLLVVMKLLIQIAALLTCITTIHAQERYRFPKLTITAVSIPVKKAKPLKIAFTVKCVGQTIALSQDQFSVSISTEKDPYFYFGSATFPPDSPNIFRLNPNEEIRLTLLTLRDRNSPKKSWGTLPPGKYTLRIYVNSGKAPEFQYQWLGQTYSNDYVLRIKS